MPVQVDHSARRDAISRHTLALAATHGLEGVTVRKVATASGFSAGTVQHYFPTREAMIAHAADLLGRIQRDRFLALDRTAHPRDLIRAAVAAYLPTSPEDTEIAAAGAAFYLASLYDDHLKAHSARAPRRLIEVLTAILTQAADDKRLADGVVPANEAQILWGFIEPSPVLAGYRTVEDTHTLVDYHLARIFR